jgi:3',5'-cyclic AMP phosphodiesterase CpdA
VLSLCLLVVLPSIATAGAFDKGPYLQNVTPSSVTIVWEASTRTAGAVTVLAPQPRRFESAASDLHEVELGGLEPGRRYRYLVESAGERVEGEFSTAPVIGEPFSFVVFGDSRSNADTHQQVADRVSREVPDFLLGTGDMVNEGGSDADWAKFFEIERALLRENVLFPSLGNHDRQGRGRTADNYRRYFSLPENSPDPERYYAFTYGNARFLILDSNSYSFALTDQTAWIEQQLQAARLDARIRHVFVSMHHPPFSVSLHGGQAELREAWTPLFEKYQVAAVFSGHDHVYSRAERNGVRYFVSGGGGAPLYPRKKRSSDIDLEATKYFERVNHYLRVHVVGEFVEATAIRSDGTIIETQSWGALPRATPDQLRALRSAPGLDTTPRRRVPAAGGPAADPVAAVAATGATGTTAATSRFGALGVVGLVMAMCAAAALVWSIRR